MSAEPTGGVERLTSAFESSGTITLVAYDDAPDVVWIAVADNEDMRAVESVRLSDLVTAVQRLQAYQAAVSTAPELAMRAEGSESE